MFKKLITFFLFILLIINPVTSLQLEAQEIDKIDYVKAVVINAETASIEQVAEGLSYAGNSQLVTVKILEGSQKDKEVSLTINTLVRSGNSKDVTVKEKLIIGYNQNSGDFFYVDRYRLQGILFIFLFLIILVIILTRKKGFLSILGLILSVLGIIVFLIPSINAGLNPLVATLVTILTVGILSFYLAHGFNQRTSIALFSTYITLAIASIFAVVFTNITKLSGGGTEESVSLVFQLSKNFDLKSLYLAGILISALGVLDDITTAQAAIVQELKRANKKFKFKELYKRSIVVGREHISSLVNTLAFAYVGSSLPLLISFSINAYQPWWLTLNTELITQEVVQIIVGSLALVISVPITSFLASLFFANHEFKDTLQDDEFVHHGHVH